MTTYYFVKKADSAAKLTAATGLVPMSAATRSVVEESWPFPADLPTEGFDDLVAYMENEGFQYSRTVVT